MQKRIRKEVEEGMLEITQNFDQHLFLARPQGIINPTLLDEDLKRATEFSEQCPDHWTYCTNTEKVRLVNPFNIIFLKEIKKLKKLREIVVYAPGFFNRLLIRMVTPIFQPDRIIKRRSEFEQFLRTVS